MNKARWLILPVILSLAGCGSEEDQDLKDFVKNSGEGMRGKIEAPPEVKPYEPFTYNNAEGLPDPFRAKKVVTGPETQTGIFNPPPHPPEELEGFPLENLKMVGYLYIDNTPYAMISAPDGKIRNVKVGNYIGQNYGQVIAITENEVKIKELIADGTPGGAPRISTLQLVE